jgi:hypothetical protein
MSFALPYKGESVPAEESHKGLLKGDGGDVLQVQEFFRPVRADTGKEAVSFLAVAFFFSVSAFFNFVRIFDSDFKRLFTILS